MSFKFGDIVRNDWAGDINPHREGMFLYYVTRDSGPFSTTRFAVLARDGKKWEHDASDEKLVVTGNVFDDLSGLREENERLKAINARKVIITEDDWAEWAKEEIIALSKIVQEKNAEIERLNAKFDSLFCRDKIKELEKLASDLIIQATCAMERGAMEMLEFIDSPLCNAWQTNEEILKQFKLWREGKK